MNRLFTCTLAATLLSACSATPTLAIPDGRNRVPANSSATIDEYKKRSAEEKSNDESRSAIARQLDAVKLDVANIKLFLAALPVAHDNRAARNANPVGRTNKLSATAIGQGGALRYLDKAAPHETIEVRASSIIFRVAHPIAGTRFNPTEKFQAQLLKAAIDGRLLDIRGRSDAHVASAANYRVSLERAQSARQFLLDHGIPVEKIQISALAARGFVAVNDDNAGRARNRRVEIEVIDLDTSSYQFSDPITKGR